MARSRAVGGERVQLAIEDLGAGVQWVDTLEAAGYDVNWTRTEGSLPEPSDSNPPDVVVLQAGLDSIDVVECVAAWRREKPPPALLVAGAGAGAEQVAAEVRARFVSLGIDTERLCERVERALSLRYAGELTASFALGLLGMPGKLGPDEAAVVVVRNANKADVSVVREALRPYTHFYATATERMTQLRELRALDVPEIEFGKRLDGSRTVRSLIESASDCGHGMDAARAARQLWAMACVQAIVLSREPIDDATPERRAVLSARHHLRERRKRLRKGAATYYDVLELPLGASEQQVDQAARWLELRYGPDALEPLDLGDLRDVAEPLWKQVVNARRTLRDRERRRRYLDYVRDKGNDVRSYWREGGFDPAGSELDFEFGQRALVDGDVFSAVSRFASAARRNPAISDYEVYLAWARFRAEVQRGADRDEMARRERAAAEAVMAGRAPRPRALLALGLLCNATGDVAAARWHLREALAADPELRAARQILERISQ